MESAGQFVSVAAVLAGLLLAVWFLRRGSLPGLRLRGGGSSGMRSVGRIVLTPQHSLHLVELGGQRVIVAAGPTGVQVIREWSGGEVTSP